MPRGTLRTKRVRKALVPIERIHSEDGVDLTLIRWMLSLTPAERLEVLQGHVDDIVAIRELNAGK